MADVRQVFPHEIVPVQGFPVDDFQIDAYMKGLKSPNLSSAIAQGIIGGIDQYHKGIQANQTEAINQQTIIDNARKLDEARQTQADRIEQEHLRTQQLKDLNELNKLKIKAEQETQQDAVVQSHLETNRKVFQTAEDAQKLQEETANRMARDEGQAIMNGTDGKAKADYLASGRAARVAQAFPDTYKAWIASTKRFFTDPQLEGFKSDALLAAEQRAAAKGAGGVTGAAIGRSVGAAQATREAWATQAAHFMSRPENKGKYDTPEKVDAAIASGDLVEGKAAEFDTSPDGNTARVDQHRRPLTKTAEPTADLKKYRLFSVSEQRFIGDYDETAWKARVAHTKSIGDLNGLTGANDLLNIITGEQYNRRFPTPPSSPGSPTPPPVPSGAPEGGPAGAVLPPTAYEETGPLATPVSPTTLTPATPVRPPPQVGAIPNAQQSLTMLQSNLKSIKLSTADGQPNVPLAARFRIAQAMGMTPEEFERGKSAPAFDTLMGSLHDEVTNAGEQKTKAEREAKEAEDEEALTTITRQYLVDRFRSNYAELSKTFNDEALKKHNQLAQQYQDQIKPSSYFFGTTSLFKTEKRTATRPGSEPHEWEYIRPLWNDGSFDVLETPEDLYVAKYFYQQFTKNRAAYDTARGKATADIAGTVGTRETAANTANIASTIK